MTVNDKYCELVEKYAHAGNAPRKVAHDLAAWAVREALAQASIADYDRETVEKRLEWLAGELEQNGSKG